MPDTTRWAVKKIGASLDGLYYVTNGKINIDFDEEDVSRTIR